MVSDILKGPHTKTGEGKSLIVVITDDMTFNIPEDAIKKIIFNGSNVRLKSEDGNEELCVKRDKVYAVYFEVNSYIFVIRLREFMSLARGKALYKRLHPVQNVGCEV